MQPAAGDEDGLGLWGWTDASRGTTLLGHRGSRGRIEAVAIHDPTRHRSIVGFTDTGADLESLMWDAWDWAEGQTP